MRALRVLRAPRALRALRALRASPLVLVASSLLVAAPARAAGILEIVGAPNASNGLSARVLGAGPEVTYFNPALLPATPPSTSVGLFLLASHESVVLGERPATADVLPSIYEARLQNPDGTTSRLPTRPVATAELASPRDDTNADDAAAYLTFGVVRAIVPERLVLGFYAALPATKLQEQSAFFADEREQYFDNRLRFELLGDRLAQPSFSLALGGNVTRWLSVGAGVDITIGTVARTAVHVPDAADQRVVLISPQIEVTSTLAPHLGVELRPSSCLHVTSTLHFPASSDTEGENKVRFWNFTYPEGEDAVRQSYATSIGYEPLRVGLGVAWVVRERSAHGTGLRVAAEGRYAQWSSYRDRHAETPRTPFEDTLSVTLGAALDMDEDRMGLDVSFAPSPVPPQDGRTNYVDGDRVGADLSFETPLSVLGVNLSATFRAFGQLLLTRTETKRADAADPVLDEVPDGAIDVTSGDPLQGAAGLQTNNPGYPGYEASGWLLGGGLRLAFPDR